MSVGNQISAGTRVPQERARPWQRLGFAGWLGLIVAAGAAVRILYTVVIAPWPPAVSDDQVFFHLQAQLIADGAGFIQPQLELQGVVRPTAAHPPFYPVVLAGLAKLGANGDLIQRLTGTLFGSGVVALTGVLGRRLAGQRVGLIAAGLAACYPILITADGALMSESLYGLLVAASVYVAYRLLDAPTWPWALALGALGGLAALTRGEALLLPILLLLPLLRRPGGLRAAAVTLVTLALVLLPWTVRNWSVFDRPVLISTNSGAVVGGANCDAVYRGPNIGGWNILCDRPFPGHNEAEETNRQLHDGAHYAREHMRRLPIVELARLGRTLSFFQPMQANAGRDSTMQDLGTVMFWLLLPLALFGLVVLRRGRAQLWPILAPVVLVLLTTVVFYGDMRFRHAAEVSLLVFAAAAIDRLIRRSSQELPQEGSRP
jgi:4-amino-4-deoxy-L-arabinose transferase-like glycosyltransferase